MSIYVTSTLSQDTAYAFFKKSIFPGEPPEIERKILIKGGTGVISKNLVTPHGVVTKISDEEYSLLKENPVFQMHQKNGFVVAINSKPAKKSVVKDMENRDRGSQLIPSDLKKEGMPKVLENRI